MMKKSLLYFVFMGLFLVSNPSLADKGNRACSGKKAALAIALLTGNLFVKMEK
ncbi:hypothetical protein [Thioflexithrix psekupsensis]|uniref:hypothetical protein n=1 Tax=Thioflexithrix psekupsensis TaxID=1570016 RepID=UPI001C3C6F71|nr:hypothetical protein [Thioflexithrix psekupsensis]